MRSFILEELLLVSHLERRGRRMLFHPKMTLIRGANDTGKSSVIKSIYRTFGAEPPKQHPKWKRANVISLVRFSINGMQHAILRAGDSFSVFDGRNNLLGTFSRVTTDLAPFLASIFNFRLTLVDQEGVARVPPPAFLLLPFYLDQDLGWTENWNSFTRLQQFRSWRGPVVEYHTGIRPNEYYELRARINELETRLLEPKARERVLRSVRKDIEPRITLSAFDIDLVEYTRTIAELLERCENLKAEEERYREAVVSLENTRVGIVRQLEIVKRARDELGEDFDYASSRLAGDVVACPTCGAEYNNDFNERFAVANDEERCIELFSRLRDELRKVEEGIGREGARLREASAELVRVNELLAVKQGPVTLGTLIQNEGKREVGRILDGDLKGVADEIGAKETEIRELRAAMRDYADRDRAQEIVAQYREYMRHSLAELSVENLPQSEYESIDSRIVETGSDLPRALLAYFFSILQLIQEYGSSTFCPVVIDSPNQQSQDPANFRRVLEYIRRHQPRGTQLVLGLVDSLGVEFDGTIVDMGEKFCGMREQDFEEVGDLIRPYLDANLGSSGSELK